MSKSCFSNASWKVWKPEGKWRVLLFKGTARIPGAWQRELRGIHSHNWFSTREPNTASQWQADNSANFSHHSLWMALYDRLVECDWWPGLNNGTIPPPFHARKRHCNTSWHTKHFPNCRAKQTQSIRGELQTIKIKQTAAKQIKQITITNI